MRWHCRRESCVFHATVLIEGQHSPSSFAWSAKARSTSLWVPVFILASQTLLISLMLMSLAPIPLRPELQRCRDRRSHTCACRKGRLARCRYGSRDADHYTSKLSRSCHGVQDTVPLLRAFRPGFSSEHVDAPGSRPPASSGRSHEQSSGDAAALRRNTLCSYMA